MKVLVTGSAGFIGSALTLRLLDRGDEVIGIDNHNDYYDPSLKEARLSRHKDHKNYIHIKLDIEDRDAVDRLFKDYQPQRVVNLAAQAGVRYSIENPHSYASSNILGFLNILECCKQYNVKHLLYASSSSVYGGNVNLPFNESQNVDHPVSFYAATKKSNELMAHSYSHLFNIPTTGLRFFTVYGPWGRPDMALFKFAKKIINKEPIDVYNFGDMTRDFTYVDDVVKSISLLIDNPPLIDDHYDKSSVDPATSWSPFRVLNIGNSDPSKLMDYIEALESSLGSTAVKNFLPMQPGDVQHTSADCTRLFEITKFKPATPISEGVSKFVQWYKEYYL